MRSINGSLLRTDTHFLKLSQEPADHTILQQSATIATAFDPSPTNPIPDDQQPRLLLGSALALLLAISLLVYPLRAQEASRFALTAAIWDHHTISIDGYPIGVDRAVRDGVTYSDKAPGQSVLLVPFYAIGRLLGFSSAQRYLPDGNLSLWWVTLWGASVPAVALFLMARRLVPAEDQAWANVAGVAVATGTLLLPLSTVLFAHVLATVLLLGCALLLRDPTSPRAAMAGLIGGLAVTTDYTLMIGVAVLVVLASVRDLRHGLLMVAGGTPVAVLLGLYNEMAFGSPFRLSYQFTAFQAVTSEPRSITSSFSAASMTNAIELFFSGRGLLIATPIVLVGMVGLVLLAKSPRTREMGILGLVMVGFYLMLPIFWSNPWGGESPGARYMTPALIFLVPGIARAWSRFRVVCFGAWLISAATMLLASLTDSLAITRNDPRGISVWLEYARDGEWMPNLLQLIGGSFGTFAFWSLLFTSFVGVTVILARRSLMGRLSSNESFG